MATKNKPARTRVYVGPVKADSVFQLKVTIADSRPPIWRRLLVRSDADLEELHVAIQTAFGWVNCHLHEFFVPAAAATTPSKSALRRRRVEGRHFQPRPPEGFDEFFGDEVEDEKGVRLESLALKPGSMFAYTYDFGDGWEHEIVVEKALAAPEAEAVLAEISGKKFTASSRTPVAACIDGRRAGPMEDSGGIYGYMDLCAIMADPEHPEHEERVEWVRDFASNAIGQVGFDPERFEIKPVNADMLKYLKR